MALISIVEYAKLHSKEASSAKKKAQRGGFKTARKIGRNWVIDEDEPYDDRRYKMRYNQFNRYPDAIRYLMEISEDGNLFEDNSQEWDLNNLLDEIGDSDLHLLKEDPDSYLNDDDVYYIVLPDRIGYTENGGVNVEWFLTKV